MLNDKYSPLMAEVEKILTHVPEDGVWLDEILDDVYEELVTPVPAIQVPEWTHFNDCTGGLRAGEFSIICGPTGSGKTTWLANLSAALLTSGVRHMAASVETGHVDFGIRVLSSLNHKDYNTGRQFSAEEIKSLYADFAPILKSRGLYLTRYASKIEPRRMLCDLLWANRELGCKVAILDNLNFFMPFTDAADTNVSMDKIIHEFIIFCKSVDMHIIMVMHPRKTQDGRIEHENDIKGSSTATQEAHNIFLFNRPSKEDQLNGYDKGVYRDLRFAKLRRRGEYVYKRIMYRNNGSHYVECELL